MSEQRARRVGRVRAVVMSAPLLDLGEPDPMAGTDLVLHCTDGPVGSTMLRFEDGSGTVLGRYLLTSIEHEDALYGDLSLATAAHCYGSQLEVTEAARGRGLGAIVVSVARRVAAERYQRGVMGIVERSNAPSLRCNHTAGLRETLQADGIRIGGRVHWWRRRALTS